MSTLYRGALVGRRGDFTLYSGAWKLMGENKHLDLFVNTGCSQTESHINSALSVKRVL